MVDHDSLKWHYKAAREASRMFYERAQAKGFKDSSYEYRIWSAMDDILRKIRDDAEEEGINVRSL